MGTSKNAINPSKLAVQGIPSFAIIASVKSGNPKPNNARTSCAAAKADAA